MKLITFCLAVTLMLAAGRASATLVLDQAYLDEDGAFGIGDAAAQTFTVGITGLLSRVELRLGLNGNPDGNLYVYIRNAETGIAGPFNLGAITVPRINLPVSIHPDDYISLDFSLQDIHVNAGESLAIIVDINDIPGVDWGLGKTVQTSGGLPVGGYPNGLALVGSNPGGWAVLPYNPSFPDIVGLDFNFRTFVQPIPEPSSLILCLLVATLAIPYAWWLQTKRTQFFLSRARRTDRRAPNRAVARRPL